MIFVIDCWCYKQNPSIGTDPTVKPVIASLIAQHKEKTTHTLDGLVFKAVKRVRRRGEGLAKNPS